jgi:hypothetical protein
MNHTTHKAFGENQKTSFSNCVNSITFNMKSQASVQQRKTALLGGLFDVFGFF